MKVLRFEGYSDDTFGEYAFSREDYDNCASGDPITFKVWSEEQKDGLYVFGQYCPSPATGWMIGVARWSEDDDTPMPLWPMRFDRAEREYTPSLIIEAPDDVAVTHVHDAQEAA